MTVAPAIVWFRSDLRVADNRALAAAIAAGDPVVALYVLDDAAAGRQALGAASRWWLHHSLKALAAALGKIGIQLVLRRGRAEEVLADIQRTTGAGRVEAHRAYERWARDQEVRVRKTLDASGAGLHLHNGNLLFEPDTVETQAGEPFRVFTPYSRVVMRRTIALPAGSSLPSAAVHPPVSSARLADWKLLPVKPDWAGGLRATWTPGEAGARQQLEAFLSAGIAAYAEDRNRPDVAGTSMLSPHLRFGEISPARVWHEACRAAMCAKGRADAGLASFQRELVWREFSYHLLWYWPDLAGTPFRKEFERFPYLSDPAGLEAWRRGRTGYPIVDAGMRQLWTTGYMHNRVRMIAGSFLTKDLLIDWREGERWFWDTLVDADPANNTSGWQWIAGCGADAAPYFRIYNPIKQGQSFDPEGAYVRRWIPELANLPDEHVHAPWLAPAQVLEAAGVILGDTYPHPIVDHAAARQRALAAFAKVKG